MSISRFLPALCLIIGALPALAQENPAKKRITIIGPAFGETVRAGGILGAQLKPIQGVQVTPQSLGAIFSFQTQGAANPQIRIGKSAPVQAPRGREPQTMQWDFPADEVAAAFLAPRQDRGGVTQHTLRLQPVLAPNTTYHYIITVGSGAGVAQEIGTFTTITRRVKVVYQKIRVLKGGDGAGIGDTFFQFFANYDAQSNRNWVWLGGRDTPLKVADGAWVDANKEFTLHNVDEVRLAVNGYDEDALTLGAPPRAIGAKSVVVDRPLNFATHNDAGAWNVASADFNLALLPSATKAITVPFTLRSLGPAQVYDIEFEVTGFYTVTPTLSKSEILLESLKTRGGIAEALKVRQPAPTVGPPSSAVRRGGIRIPNR